MADKSAISADKNGKLADKPPFLADKQTIRRPNFFSSCSSTDYLV
ncbi:hypothetical protein [Bacillus sp. J33]|nr:hypothetical protein [Bacillus sp. J33]